MKCFLLVALLFIFTTGVLFAAEVPFIRDYTYQASEIDSKITSRNNAITEVKRLLLEEIGTYLESQTEVKNFRLTKDEIIMFTAGIAHLKIIEEKWDGSQYYLKAQITVDPENVAKSIDNLRKDRQRVKELEDAKKKADELRKETTILKKELETARAEAGNQKLKKYNEAMSKLAALNLFTQTNERSGALKVGVYTNGIQNAKTIEYEKFIDQGTSIAFRVLQLDYDYTKETDSDSFSQGTYSEKGSGKGGGATIHFFPSGEEEPKGPYFGFGLNFYFVNYSSVDKPNGYTTNITDNASATVIDFNMEAGYKMVIFNTIDIEPALLLGAYQSSSGGDGYYILPGLSLGIRF